MRRLADELTATGNLSSPRWRAAVCAVPRHELVPDVWRRDPDGSWHRMDSSTAQGRREWLGQVYSNTVLVTAITGTGGLRSSSSMPGLMTRMLENLDVHDGHRVLEIGTGTGYNAGLLTHRLGAANVFSVDIEPDLVDLARDRLARQGLYPTLVVGDGAAGLAEHAPFDRIMATCAVPAVPWAWVEQTRIGGVILTDLKPALGAGNLVRLTRYGDRAEGRFDPTYAVFMDLRHRPADHDPVRRRPRKDRSQRPDQRSTVLDPRTPWQAPIVWFLACFELGPDIALGYNRPDDAGAPTATSVTAADGSWAEVALDEHNGRHRVVEGGNRRVWRVIEAARAEWTRLGRPGWDRFGLTVVPTGQFVWLDSPAGRHRWPLVVADDRR